MLHLMNPNEMLIRFRQLLPFQQAVIAGLIFFVIYALYGYFFMELSLLQAAKESTFSVILFIIVYYFTSVIITRKTVQMENRSKGPKKGLRGK
jgi:hypothetical protein